MAKTFFWYLGWHWEEELRRLKVRYFGYSHYFHISEKIPLRMYFMLTLYSHNWLRFSSGMEYIHRQATAFAGNEKSHTRSLFHFTPLQEKTRNVLILQLAECL